MWGIVVREAWRSVLRVGEREIISLVLLLVMIFMLVLPIVYLLTSSIDLQQMLEILTSVKIPPDGELYTVYNYPGYVLIYITVSYTHLTLPTNREV